jgi:hypothetical protein
MPSIRTSRVKYDLLGKKNSGAAEKVLNYLVYDTQTSTIAVS